MPKAPLLLTSLLSLCLALPGMAQQTNQENQQQQKQNQKQNQKQQTQNKNRQGNTQNQQKQNQKLVDVSLDQGQSISIPAGGELLELTVAVPQNVRAGQRYRYRARVRNTSEGTTLANVRLVQLNGNQVDIEDSELTGQKNQQQKNQKNQQQQQSQSARQAQQGGSQQSMGNNQSWRLGQLKPGESRELAVTAVASQAGNLEHCFAVKYDEVLCAQLEVVNPDVSITKSGPDQVPVCELFEYKYTVKNTGTGVAKDFIVRDELPEGLKTKSGEDTLEFRVPSLGEGESQTYLAEVHAMEAGSYGSRATVEQESGETGRSQEVNTQVVAPELNVEIQGPRAFKADEGGNFDVLVENTSDVVARNVELNIDPGQNARVTNAGQGDARDGGRRYVYRLGNMEPGQRQSVSISLNADQQQGGTNNQNNQRQENQQQNQQQENKNRQALQIKAVAKAICEREGQEDMAVAEAEASMQSRALRLTSLLLTVVDMEDVIPQGKTITYQIRVRNQGSFEDENVKLNLRLPSGLTFKSADGPTDASANGQRVNLGTVDKIAAGETLEWKITTNAESAGEKIVEATLESKALSKSVEAQEISTIYDASQQRSGGQGTQSAQKNENRNTQKK